MAALAAAIDGRREAPAADRVPTLTEVVELGQQATAAIAFGALLPAAGASASESADVDLVPLPGAIELSGVVLAELLPRIEMLLEERLREALAPALARAADGLIRDAREQLAGTLQGLVQEAVNKLLDQRHSG